MPLAAVVALLGLAMLATAFSNPKIDIVQKPPPPLTTSNAASPFDESQFPLETSATPSAQGTRSIDFPPWVEWAVSGACALIVLIVLSVLVWMLLRDRIGQRQIEMVEPEVLPTDEETEQTVRAAVDAGLAELDDADADPRRAVIACWVRLEAAAAAAGTERSPGDTSTELVSRLLARHYVTEPVLAALAEVYREARFARHEVHAATREQARTALRLLRDELSAGARSGN
jgi:hypothetical protein